MGKPNPQLVLLLLLCLDVLAFQRAVNITRKPYGPEMCKDLCARSLGSFTYARIDLSCSQLQANGSDTLGPDTLGPDTLGSDTLGPDTLGSDTLGSDTLSFTCLKEERQFTTSVSPGTLNDNCSERVFSSHEQMTLLATHIIPKVVSPKQSLMYNRIFHQACSEGDLCLVKHILSQNLSDINYRGKFGRTAIMWAASFGQVAVFDFLVTQGCDLLVADEQRNNLLHLACKKCKASVVKRLLDSAKYNLESKDSYDETPAMKAVDCEEVFILLVNNGCNLTAVNSVNNNVLHYACDHGNFNVVKFILSRNIHMMESQGFNGITPVLLTAMSGSGEIFDFLVSKGCDLKVITTEDFNILHLASLGGNIHIVTYIVQEDIFSIHTRGRKQVTPILMAAAGGNVAVFKFLLSRGSELTDVDIYKNNILHTACHKGQMDIVKYILKRNYIDIDSRDVRGKTVLMKAAAGGHKDVFKFLVSRGCSPSVIDGHRNNVLHIACCKGKLHMVKYIITNNMVPIDTRGNHRRTPVLIAAQYGQRKIVSYLVSKGCNLWAVDDGGNSILHVVSMKGHVEILRDLITHGEGRRMKGLENRRGNTPSQLAWANGHRKIVSLLKDKD